MLSSVSVWAVAVYSVVLTVALTLALAVVASLAAEAPMALILIVLEVVVSLAAVVPMLMVLVVVVVVCLVAVTRTAILRSFWRGSWWRSRRLSSLPCKQMAGH